MSKKAVSKKGTYKPFRMIRVPEPLAAELEAIAQSRYSTMTEQAKQAIREFVESNRGKSVAKR